MTMEEERPTKIQKRDHTSGVGDTQDAQFADHPTAANGDSEWKEASTTTEQQDPEKTKNQDDSNDQNGTADSNEATAAGEAPKLSKNQLKKLKKQQQWEDGREARKEKRKEKAKAKKERRREEYRQSLANGEIPAQAKKSASSTQLPLTVIFDCDWDNLMFDQELKSLGTQLTRCYADNRQAPFRTHLSVSSFGGKLKERFDGVLAKQYLGWQHFQFFQEDVVAVAEKAKGWMKAKDGGRVAGALVEEGKDTAQLEAEGEIVYLSSESEVTLDRLKPYSTYIIGGLVDKNRHKGICHKKATELGIKTAKLPISEFLEMKSRQVLATNHVLEIMLKWLEVGDWGEAFMEVMPKRKGGTLKSGSEEITERSKRSGSPESNANPENVTDNTNGTSGMESTQEIPPPNDHPETGSGTDAASLQSLGEGK